MAFSKGKRIEDETSQRIIDLAIHIGCVEGPDALTVTRICRELNCDRRVIYNRFRDIDEINLIVAGRCNDELLRNAQNAMKEEAGYYENLIALVQAEFTYIYEKNAFFQYYTALYQVCLLYTSHDRYFLDRTVRRIFAFEGNGVIRQYEGGYTDYQAKVQEENGVDTISYEEKSNELKNLKTVKNRQDKLKFTYKEQREYETIDDDIAALEEKIEKLEQDIVTNARDFVKLNELTKEKETTQALLDEKMDRWVYLQDLAERIEQQNH